jgi:ER membrane protein complex subunit 3
LTGILRHYATILLQSDPKKQELPKLREHRSLLLGTALRNNGYVLSSQSFNTRRAWYVEQCKSGAFLADPESRGQPRPNPMTDPAMMEGMMGAMKGNVAMMVPQTLIMGWINAFFSGFVISK